MNDTPNALRTPPPGASPMKEKKVVLVADDDPGTRLLVRKKLEGAGYQVICAKNGKEAIHRLSDRVAAAVLDLMMPDIDGLECLLYIREHYPDMSPVMLTASDNLANAVEAMKRGALDYLTKPFNSGQLIALIGKAVDTFEQSRRLRAAEAKLEKIRQHEIFVASQIQRTLLLGCPPEDIDGLEIAHLTIPSQQIDGDFYDFIRLTPDTLDIIVADIMGKGIMAAFMGAALKSAFLRVINAARFTVNAPFIPDPKTIVKGVQANMIRQMEELDTFVTLCYGRFDQSRNQFSFVDCGHVRSIYYQAKTHTVNLLRGVNMPLGFPDPSPFQQFFVPYATGDLFLFYSDGLTEAANPDGELYDESRLVRFVEQHAALSPEALLAGIHNEIIAFTGTDVFTDDFTGVAVRILSAAPPPQLRNTSELKLENDLKQLKGMRSFVRRFCRDLPGGRIDANRLAQIEVAATEVMTNIIKHAYDSASGRPIHVIAEEYDDHVLFSFYDRGKPFDPTSVPPPVLDGTQENGMGCYIIAQFVDEVTYSRDENEGKNCARLKIVLFPSESQ